MDGILLLDKPEGLSSNQALQRARRVYGAAKAGHAGTLDPLASGMLACCFGEATKITGHLIGSRKTYRARVRLGVATSTGDREGEVVAQGAVPTIDRTVAEDVARRFVGRILQRPPLYSALKRGGVPLYRLARRGVAVEVTPRPVEIESIAILAVGGDWIELEVVCGSGTYIRSLAVGMGEALDCPAHLEALRRIWLAPFEGRTMRTLVEIESAESNRSRLMTWLLPIAEALAGLPRVRLDQNAAQRFRQGQTLPLGLPAANDVRVDGPSGNLLGLGVVDSVGRLRPRRLIHSG